MKNFFLYSCVVIGLLVSACTTHAYYTYNPVGVETPDNLIYSYVSKNRVTCKKVTDWCEEVYDCLLSMASQHYSANTIIDVRIHKYKRKDYSPVCVGSALPANLIASSSQARDNKPPSGVMMSRNIQSNNSKKITLPKYDDFNLNELSKETYPMNSESDPNDDIGGGKFKF